jgi:hypothetical protein
MTGRGCQEETLPCYCFGSNHALLPAFGSITGRHSIRPGPQDRIDGIAGEQVIRVGNKSFLALAGLGL